MGIETDGTKTTSLNPESQKIVTHTRRLLTIRVSVMTATREGGGVFNQAQSFQICHYAKTDWFAMKTAPSLAPFPVFNAAPLHQHDWNSGMNICAGVTPLRLNKTALHLANCASHSDTFL